jgi:Flp pilus assembly protein TadD
MSRRRDHRRKKHRPHFGHPLPPVRTQNQRPIVSPVQKRIAVSAIVLLLAGGGFLWQSSRSKPPERSEATVFTTALPTHGSTSAAPVPTNGIPLLASTMDASNNPAKSDQAAVKLNQQANQLMTAGDLQGAIRLYEKGLALTPEDEDLHFNLGIAYAKAGDSTKAEEHYREALRLLPDYAEVRNNLGNLLLRAGRWDEAAQQLQEAIKLQPEYAAAYNNLGIVRQKQKRLDDATACFEKAVRYDTNYLEAHFNLASASLLAGNRDKAISEFGEVLRLDPAFEAARLGLAKALQK